MSDISQLASRVGGEVGRKGGVWQILHISLHYLALGEVGRVEGREGLGTLGGGGGGRYGRMGGLGQVVSFVGLGLSDPESFRLGEPDSLFCN